MKFFYISAPFAACRSFTAGWYRPTAPFLTPSAIYGLILNVAGIESRLREEDPGHDGSVPSSLSQFDLPKVEIAIGVPASAHNGSGATSETEFPRVQSVYQQLHNYPVGKETGKHHVAACYGNKHNITPVRREFLSDVHALVAMRGNLELEERVVRGLNGEFNQERYGIPFLGDNSFLLDRFEELYEAPPTRWFERVTTETEGIKEHTSRLTIMIHRGDPSQTNSDLFAPTESQIIPPTLAWIKIEPATTTIDSDQPQKRNSKKRTGDTS